MNGHAALLSQHWTTILPPPPPPSLSAWWLLSAVFLFGLTLMVVMLLWRQRSRQRALHTLHQCLRQLRMPPKESKQIAYTAYRALLQGLGSGVANVKTAKTHCDRQCRELIGQLQRCAFAAKAPSPQELAELIRQGHQLLRDYRG